MSKRRFRLSFGAWGGLIDDSAVIELDDRVIEAVDDEWRAVFCDLHTPEDIAKHVGFNLIFNLAPLSSLDGWADQPDSNARVLHWPDWDCLEIEAEEIRGE